MKFAWIIEECGCDASRPTYFTGNLAQGLSWSKPGEHSAACRFFGKDDADKIAASIDGRNHRVAEHGWE